MAAWLAISEAWPITINQALFLLPGVYDAIWLGQLGPDAQAAAVLTMSVRITMISVLMALSLASGTVVARACSVSLVSVRE